MNSIEGVEESKKISAIQDKAQKLFQAQADWATYFREVLGPHGIMQRSYADRESLAQFRRTAEYHELQSMFAQLRNRNGSETNLSPDEFTRVITVRLPKSLHSALKTEAHSRKTSMNQLCISKLLQAVNEELIPNSRQKNSAPPAESA